MAGRRNGGRPSIEEQGLRRLEAAIAGRPEADGRIPGLEATICDVTGGSLTDIVENNCRSIFQRLGMEEIQSDWDPAGEEPPYEGVKDGVPWFSGEVLGNYLVSSEAELYRAERLYEALAVELVKRSVVVDSIKSRLAAARRRANDELAMPGKTQMIFARRLARALEAGNIGTAEFKLLTVNQISQICEVLKPDAVVPPAVTAMMAQALAAVGSKPADVVEAGVDDGGLSAGNANQAVNSGSENFVDSSAGALDTDGADPGKNPVVLADVADTDGFDHGKNPVVFADSAESEFGMGANGGALEVFCKPPVSEKTAEVSQKLGAENKGEFAQGSEEEVFCNITGVRTVGQWTPNGRSGEDDESIQGEGRPAEAIGDSDDQPPVGHDSEAGSPANETVVAPANERVLSERTDPDLAPGPATSPDSDKRVDAGTSTDEPGLSSEAALSRPVEGSATLPSSITHETPSDASSTVAGARVTDTGGRMTDTDVEPVQQGREDLDRIMMPADMPYFVVERRMVSADDREALSIPWPDMDGPHAGWRFIRDRRDKVDGRKLSLAQSGAMSRSLDPVLVLMDLWAEFDPAEARRQGLVDASGVVRPLVAEAWAVGAIMMVREGVVELPVDPLALHGAYLPPRIGREGWVRQLVTREPLAAGRRPMRLVPGVDGDAAMASADGLARLVERWDANVSTARDQAAREGGGVHPEPVIV